MSDISARGLGVSALIFCLPCSLSRRHQFGKFRFQVFFVYLATFRSLSTGINSMARYLTFNGLKYNGIYLNCKLAQAVDFNVVVFFFLS